MEVNLSLEMMQKICDIAKSNQKAMKSNLHTYELGKFLHKNDTEEKGKKIDNKIKEIQGAINDSIEVYDFFSNILNIENKCK